MWIPLNMTSRHRTSGGMTGCLELVVTIVHPSKLRMKFCKNDRTGSGNSPLTWGCGTSILKGDLKNLRFWRRSMGLDGTGLVGSAYQPGKMGAHIFTRGNGDR